MIIQSQAIVLKSFSYSETSIIARCFTREMGKISVIIRGAKRKNSPNAAYFQPANYLDLVFYPVQNIKSRYSSALPMATKPIPQRTSP